MTNFITKQVIAEYEAKIKKRYENKPKGSDLRKWLTEINMLIHECNSLLGYEKYKIEK